jgi:chromosome segregation ATPase
MSEDKSSPGLDLYDEKKPDLDEKNDKDTYSNGSNSQISVYGPVDQNRFHRCMMISIVVHACLFIAFALGVIFGMTVGFMDQHGQISELEQRLTAHNKSLSERIDDLESQFLHCQHCNSTVHSDSSTSYDDRELYMKLDSIAVALTEVWNQLNSSQFVLSEHGQQITALQQQAKENISRIEAKLVGLDEFVANMSEQINHLFLMRDDHGDQLSLINSNISNIFTQLIHFNGSVNSLTSGLETQRAEVASLTDRVSTLDSHVDELDRRDTAKDAQLEQTISRNEQRINGIQSDGVRVSNQIDRIKGRLDSLERSSGAAAFHHCLLHSAVVVVVSCVIPILTL